MCEYAILYPVYQRSDLENLFPQIIENIFNSSHLPRYILLAIDGPLNQSFNNKISEMSHLYPIRIVESKKRIGLAKVLNLGLDKIDTKFTFRVDGDDFSRPCRWEKQLKALYNGYDLVGGQIAEIRKDQTFLAKRLVPLSQSNIYRNMSYRNPFNHMTVAFNTQVVKEIGGYPDIYLREDWALWALFVKHKKAVINLNEILVDAITDDEMFTRRGGWKIVLGEYQMQKFLFKELNKNIILCGVHLILRSSIFLMPSVVRKYTYMKLLRKT